MRALYAIDLDADPAESGADAGRDVLVRLRATVDLVHVDPFDMTEWLPEAQETFDWIEAGGLDRRDEQLCARLREILDAWPPELRGTARVVRGRKPAEEIVATGAGYSLVTVGTASRHGPPRLWLGSVAE